MLPGRPLLRMSDVSKHYPKSDSAPAATVLRDITLTVHAGEWLAIVGPSGSGKSTLMHLLGCLDRPTGGVYRVDARLVEGRSAARDPSPSRTPEQGADCLKRKRFRDIDTDAPFTNGTPSRDDRTYDVAEMTPRQMAGLRRDTFGFIFQRYHLLDYLDAADNVALPASYQGDGRAHRTARRKQAATLLTAVGLGEHAAHLPAALSGGQQQRVSLARALMNGADVILADEPTGALDSASGRDVLALLRRLHAQGRTVIVVTHSQEVAEAAQRIITMRDGRIVSDCVNPHYHAVIERPETALPERGVACPWRSKARHAPRHRTRRLDRAGEHLAAAWRILWRHRMRTLLMIISVMMGIAAVVLMLAVGAGARNKQLEEIRSYGVDATYVMPGASASDSRRTAIETLTKNDADALRLLPDVVGVSAMSTFSGEVVRGATKIDATVYGVDADYFDASVRRFRDGRMFGSGAISKQSAVAVIDAQGYQTLFPQGGPAIGQRILVAKVPVTIIGILEDEDNGIPGNGLELYMPITAVQGRLNGRWHADFLRLSLRPGVSVDAAEAAVSATLLARHRRKDFHLMSFTKYIEIQKRTARTMGIVMLVSAAIALSIGGIGVMNMMLVAVRERVAEIGIRLAVGAARADIARQFLLEALLICLIGGVAGVGLSLAVASIMPWAAPSLPLQPTATSLIGACLGSIVIGITFGLLPARQAARMDPIAALTHG